MNRPAGVGYVPSLSAAFVLAATLGLLADGIRDAVQRLGNLPVAEDWSLVGPVARRGVHLSRWLWEPHAGGRAPLTRLIGFALTDVSRDFRTMRLLSLLVGAAASVVLLLLLRRLRGSRTRMSDVVIPLLLLDPALAAAHAPSALLGAFVPLALSVVLTWAIVADPVLQTRHWAVIATLAMLGLPLTGNGGIALAVGAAIWIAVCGHRHWPPRDPAVASDTGPLLLLGVLALGTLIGLYFMGFHREGGGTPATLLRSAPAGLVAATFDAIGGSADRRATASVAGAFIIGAWLVCGLALARLREGEKVRALGLGCVMTGCVAGATSGGWPFAVGAVLAAWFIWELYGPPLATVLAGSIILVAVAAAFPAGARLTRERRERYRSRLMAIEGAVREGRPPEFIAARHREFLLPRGDAAELTGDILLLRATGIGVLAGAPDGSGAPRR